MEQPVQRTRIEELFFILLRAGLSGRKLDHFPKLNASRWEFLLEMARKQTVIGMLYQGVSLLPEGYPLPQGMLFLLIAEIDKIEKESRKVQETARQLTEEFEAAGLHPLIMKGPEVAKFYPQPLLRECGDIDLYFTPEEFGKAVSIVGEVTPAPDGSVHYKREGIDIDQHRSYFDIHSRNLPAVPSPEATLLMLSGHILKHCMGSGIGLRQLCDIAVAYKALQVPEDRLRHCFREAGLERWNKLLFSFLHTYLDADPLYEDRPSPEPLLKMILEGGNFGHHSAAREATLRKSPFRRKLGTAGLFLRRLPFSLHYAPKELFPMLGELLRGNLTH